MQEANSFADENGLLFMETSAKNAMNVNEIFMAIGNVNVASMTDLTIIHNRCSILLGVFCVRIHGVINVLLFTVLFNIFCNFISTAHDI